MKTGSVGNLRGLTQSIKLLKDSTFGRVLGKAMIGECAMNGNKFVKRLLSVNVALAAVVLSVVPAKAELLQGNISKDGMYTRLARPADANVPAVDNGPPIAPPRLMRPADNYRASAGLVDTSAFKPTLNGNARQDDTRLGIVQKDDFKLPRGFDLGAERNSKELTLAWEKWHKQFSQAIYERWSSVADEPGRATVRVSVDRNRNIQIAFLNPSGSGRFDNKLRSVIESLNGNPGLTFPSKSQRPSVSFEADYIAATNVTPGYSWVKNDYEKVRENY